MTRPKREPEEQHQNPITVDEAAESSLDKLRRDCREAIRQADLQSQVGTIELGRVVMKLIDYLEETDTNTQRGE